MPINRKYGSFYHSVCSEDSGTTPGEDLNDSVKVSGSDSTAGSLSDKLVAGANITLTENNSGGYETFTIEATAPTIDTNDSVKVSANDTTEGFLNGKLIAGTGITFTEGNDGGDETLTIDANASTGGVTTKTHVVTGVTNGQTSFTIPEVQAEDGAVMLAINDILYLTPEFSVSGQDITWNNSFVISSTDTVKIRYTTI